MTGPRIEPEAERRARIQRETQVIQSAIREGRLPPEAMQRYIERERITPEMEAEREPLGVEGTVKGALANTAEGVGFSLADEMMGGLRGAIDPRITVGEGIDEVRSERDRFAEAHPKTALSLTLGGGLLSGVGLGMGAAKAAPAAAKGAAILASGAGGAALAGYGSGEGPALDLSRLGRAAGFGAGGALLGAGAARLAQSRVGDAMGRGATDLIEALSLAADGPAAAMAPAATAVGHEGLDAATQAAVRSIAARTGGASAVPEARNLLDEISRAGLGDEAIAADVMPSGGRELRRAFNVSPRAAASGREQLLTRGANVGPRAERALTQATGLSSQTTAAGVDELITARAANAKPLYAAAEAEGAVNRMTPRTPATHAALQEPDIRATVASLKQLREYRGMADDDPRLLQAAYAALSQRQATLGSGVAQAMEANRPGFTGQAGLRDVGQAKSEVMEALAGPMGPTPSFRPAVEQYADDSTLRRAYESGLDLFNQPEGNIRAAMAKMTPDEVDVFKRGAFDALLERSDATMPNPNLGAAARQSKRAGQSTVDTQAAAKRMRALFGDAEYEKVLAAAKGEGRFTQTANDALANSTTAQQLGDMGLFGQMAVEAAGAQPASPAWWARGAQGAVDRVRRIVDEPASRRGAELMLGKPETLLDLLEQLGITDASRATTAKQAAGVVTRTGAGTFRP